MESHAGDDPFRTVAKPSAAGKTDADPALGTTIGMSGDSLASSASTSSAALAQIGEYQILSEIARGGMGVVYKARHRSLGRLAAIKLIKSGEFAQSDEVQRFQVEAQAAAVLDHPGIVPVYEVGQQGAQHYLAMAYIDGQSLAQRVKESPLTPHDAARVMQQVAAAVQYAHDQGIVHRDLKPQNILMTKDGQPKVTDFGLAKKQGGDSNLTATGQILGTPSFMPPEQTKGTSDQIGPLADVYSLGATLYCLLTGRPPFQAATPLETMLQVANQDPVPPRQLNPSIPRDLETICLKCLQKNPEQRYSSAGDFAADLGRYQAGEAILARPVGRFEKAWRWCRKRPAVAGLAASFVVLLVMAGVTGWLVQKQHWYEQEERLMRSFERHLDRPTADPSFITQGESLLAALAVFAPARSEQELPRLWQTYTNAIDAGIRQQKLTDEDEQKLTAALTTLSEHDVGLAAPLQKLLDGRRRSWRPVAELKTPFADVAKVFAADNVELKAGKLMRRGDPLGPDAAAPVLTNVTAAGKVRVETTFDGDWEATERLGIEFRYDERNRYVFMLTAPPATDAEEKATFAAVRRGGKHARAQILRNDVPLRSQELQLPDGPLRLDAQRDGDQLEFRVGTADEVLFEDIFAIRSHTPARFALLWPVSAGLQNFTISTMPAAETVHPLDEGDLLFAGGDYEAALARYRELAAVTAEEAIRQEARYKSGMCLTELRRPDDAADVFEGLIAETGERWPMLAAIQLWASQIKAKKKDEADSTFDAIAGRYSFSELASLIPETLRAELIELYQPSKSSSRMLRMMSYDPQRQRSLERYALVMDLFHDSEVERLFAHLEVIDTIWASGRHELAYRMLDEAMQRSRGSREARPDFMVPLFAMYLAKEFKLQRAETALAMIEAKMETLHGISEYPLKYWLMRAECEAQLGQYVEAVRSLEAGSARLPLKYGEHVAEWKLMASPLMGLLKERLGDSAGALAAWRDATNFDARQRIGHMTWLHYQLLRGLSRDFDRTDADVLISRLAGVESGTYGAAIRGFINPDLLVIIFREMFHTPHGREIAWEIAGGKVFPSEQSEKVAALILYEFIRQSTFEGTLVPEQDEGLWRLAREAVRLAAHEGKFSPLQVGQLAVAWRGELGFLGWGGLATSLPQEFRSAGAYALAHKMLRRGQPEHAAKLFSESLTYAEPNSSIAYLAQQDAELLQAGQGIVIIRNAAAEPVAVEILSGDMVAQRIDVEQEAEIVLPVGDYAWRTPDAAKGQFTLSLCGRRIVELPAIP